MVCLIKPQFEAGREKVGKKGVVREPDVHVEVISKVMDYADSLGFLVLGLDYSPIKGPEGNIEYLIFLELKKGSRPESDGFSEHGAEQNLQRIIQQESGISAGKEWKERIGQTVKAAHEGNL